MKSSFSRREWLGRMASVAAGSFLYSNGCSTPIKQAREGAGAIDFTEVSRRCLGFIQGCARADGGYNASTDPGYEGNSDTQASDLAAVTYAATLARTMRWSLPHPQKSVEFIQSHQRSDGRFENHAGRFEPDDPLAILYNTTQGIVALRALDSKPEFDCLQALDFLFEDNRFQELPLYTTSFFPLFFAAQGKPLPESYREAVRSFMINLQAEDGYLQDHVAATYHMAHFFRMIGELTPRAEAMVQRTLQDQKPTGGWDIKEPDWDVHACFDAVFILSQLGGASAAVRASIDRAVAWVGDCQNEDGGFGHFPGWRSDMDAVYFQFGTLIQAGKIPGAELGLEDAHTLSWGHAMQPGRIYASQ